MPLQILTNEEYSASLVHTFVFVYSDIILWYGVISYAKKIVMDSINTILNTIECFTTINYAITVDIADRITKSSA